MPSSNEPDFGHVGHLHGDPYPEPEAKRGVCLATIDTVGLEGVTAERFAGFDGFSKLYDAEPYDYAGFMGGPGGCFGQPSKLSDAGGQILNQFGGHAHRFPEDAVPPFIPDQLYPLSGCTVIHVLLGKKQPSELGNDLLEFFTERLASEILKVNTTKFTIKANVLVDMQTCTIKARTMSWGDGQYAIELQRRSGDVLAFCAAFQQAVSFLNKEKRYESGSNRVASFLQEKCCDMVGSPFEEKCFDSPASFLEEKCYDWDAAVLSSDDCLAVELESLPLNAFAGGYDPPSEAELGPLLDMAGFTDIPSLQAEAAVAIANLASDPVAVAALCCKAAFEKIELLLQQSDQAIAYPTAQALLHLAKCPQAKCWLSSESLLLSIVRKVSCKASCRLVWTELAKVVEAAVECCSDMLTASTKEHLAGELERTAVIVRGTSWGDMASEHLANARSKLIWH